ncbi:MAG: YcgN family cysteine cluster protein, partial [Paracoccaceae bacterium]
MSDPIPRTGLSPRFWERKSLSKMSKPEWEALCDGCGKCCLNKLEDEDSGHVALTRVACRLLDDATCRCAHYENRHQFVPDCIVLSPENLVDNLYWMPETCAYKLLHTGKSLFDWHPLISGTADSVH